MNKSELKSGMRVVHGNKKTGPVTGIIIRDMGLIVYDAKDGGGYNYLENYTQDLRANNFFWDITEVYDVELNEILNPSKKLKLIWSREQQESQEEVGRIAFRIGVLEAEIERLRKSIPKF